VPTGAAARLALGSAGAGQNAYVQLDRATQQLVTRSTPSGPYLDLLSSWSNASDPVSGITTLAANTTYVNVTTTCGNLACPAVSLDCDGAFFTFASPPAFAIGRPCWTLGVLWNGAQIPLTGGLAPVYSVARVDEFLTVQQSAWFPLVYHNTPASTDTLPANVTVVGSASYVQPLLSFANVGVWWAISYPAGVWNPSRTSVYWASENESVVYFDQLASAILVQWTAMPQGVQNFSVTLFGYKGTGIGTGNPNGTVPTEITLTASNITHVSGNTYTATVTWIDDFGQTYSGAYLITGSWAPDATNTSLTVNGVPVPSFNQGNGVLINPGVVNATPEETVLIVVTYTETTTFSFTQPAFTFNGLGISIALLVGLAGVVTAVVLSFVAVTRREMLWGERAVAVFLIVGFAAVLVAS
jgi:hypothetical protein